MPQRFKHPRVRDLAWVIASPVMLRGDIADRPSFSGQACDDAFLKALPKLEELDADPNPLLSYLEKLPGHRVGRYFEALTNYWLRNLTTFDVVTNNLQLRRGKQTLGEIDFLFRDGEQLVHWEAAVKYYLQLKPGCEDHEFIGPNTADNLASKLGRLFEKQLPRSTPENLALALGPLNGTDCIRRQAFVKGWLFYHCSETSPGELPGHLNSNHLKGFWIRHGEDELPKNPNEGLWALLTKPYWLAPLITHDQGALLTRRQLELLLESHFSTRESPLLVAQLQRNDSGYEEISRGFVVPANWPHLTNPPKPLR
ncbi:MAG: DUF1853 family protein [Deltaproteobacteria bacterium]|jgi:uncharacterized protein|nr:DUF1853 family protein [Deltaproteobacteria bacterium]MBT6433495.1 DUF1853 family protein [Deltaproteobacteria bacterium]MBT6489446.1 DUF1853 family protein [Deltaproteobacteria bacterium]